MFATLGGLLSSITLFTSQIAAFYVIYFLWKVSQEIKKKNEESY